MPIKTTQTPEIQMPPEFIEALKDSRFLISLDHEGKILVKPVPPDACVMSKKQMLDEINKGLILDTNMLAEFAIATIMNLKSRCDYVNSLRSANEECNA